MLQLAVKCLLIVCFSSDRESPCQEDGLLIHLGKGIGHVHRLVLVQCEILALQVPLRTDMDLHGGPVLQVQDVLICATACKPAHRSGVGIDLALSGGKDIARPGHLHSTEMGGGAEGVRV